MFLLATYQDREVWYHEAVERPFAFACPFEGKRYRVVVFVYDEAVTKEERMAVTQALFDSQCRFGAFAGEECEAWEFALDDVCIRSDPNFQPPDDAFTLTTSHADESVEEVVDYALTSFVKEDWERTLILVIGDRSGLRARIEAAILQIWPSVALTYAN